MNPHPIANIWPMMADAEIQRLAEDIKQNGLLNPIWTYEGQILDGRNRHKACLLAGVTPELRPYTGNNPVQFAFSQNEERRHLNSGQRAALAVEIKPQLEAEAKKRQQLHGGTAPGRKSLVEKIPQVSPDKSRDLAAKITGTNGKYVNAAEKIKQQAPEIFDKLKAGKITMQDAKREASRKPTDDWRTDELERQKAILAGSAVVANYEEDKNLIAWAESQGLAVAIDRSSHYGNPFILGQDGDRQTVCESYEKHYLPNKPSIERRLHELAGKVLCCHCHPKQCHGDSLIKRLIKRISQ